MQHLNKYIETGNKILGTEIPIICGAMTWISDRHLVSTVCNSGAFGVLAAGNMPPDIFKEEIAETQKLTDKKFGVNLITIAPNYKDHLEVACEAKMSHIVFAGSIPAREEVEKAKNSGATVFCFAPTKSIAKRMISFGADALILEGSEAGGHIGKVSSTVLIQQVLFSMPNINTFIAGGVATGKMMAHLLLMGAVGVQMGTRFVMSEECMVHPKFKERFRRARAREALATPQFDSQLPVVSVRSLINKGTDSFKKLQLSLLRKLEDGEINRVEAQYAVEKFWVGALKKAAIDGDIENGSLMAGQSVGLVDKILPVKEILNEMKEEAETTLKEIFNK